jgi:HupE / UreJ protein
MEQFSLYFQIGRDHILDLSMGLDHILFVFALAAGYLVSDWKKILVLVTAFTIGHSITLALATLKVITVRTDMVEFAIVVTIFIAAVSNLLQKGEASQAKVQLNYIYALFFGLIHGLGFSNTLRAILMKNQELFTPLLAFNLGLEFGQIIIVVVFLLAGFIAVSLFGVSRRDWKFFVSSAIAGASLLLIQDRIFW